MKANKIISRKSAFAEARKYFGVKRLHADVCIMGGSSPYWLFIHKGDSFEIR
jgi:hypothetical protein